MARKLVRIRPKNQITLPADVLEQLNIREDDYVQVEVTPQGVAQIAPARLAVVGSPEGHESNRRAEEDFKAGRYRTYENGEAFAKALLSREGPKEKLEHPEIIRAAMGKASRTAHHVARAIAKRELDDIARRVAALKKQLAKTSKKLRKISA
jgi:AbrB family looped-hinge helix DNA binding protein